jgi:hypothetical protein
MRDFSRNFSIAARVPEPGSRRMKRVVDWRHEHVRVRREGLGARGQLLGRPAHDGDVHLVALQHLHQLLAVAHLQPDFHARVLVLELRQQRWQEVLGGADHADGQLPGLHLLEARGRVLGVLERGQHLARVDQHVLARGGERHLPPRAFEQRQADVPLQLLDLHRDRGRREVQGLGRAREAEVAGHLVEHPQLAEGGVLH